MPERAPNGPAPSPQAGPRKEGLAANFAAIEAALLDSPRGRWFLAEYLRRNRSAETDLLLDAIARLEVAVIKAQPQVQALHASQVFDELVEMSEAISRTRREIAQIRPPHQFDKELVTASEELDHIVKATEKATSEILGAAEDIQEVAWTLREKGIEIALCDRVDQRATEIYTACSFQDITGQRTAKIVKTLRFIEQRINAMIQIWGVDDIAFKVGELSSKMSEVEQRAPGDIDPPVRGTQRRGDGLNQNDVDAMLVVDEIWPAQMPAFEPRAPLSTAATGQFGPVASRPASEESGRFEPEPLTLAKLHAVKRAALFG